MTKYKCIPPNYIDVLSCISSPCIVEVADNSAAPVQCCYIGKCKWERIEGLLPNKRHDARALVAVVNLVENWKAIYHGHRDSSRAMRDICNILADYLDTPHVQEPEIYHPDTIPPMSLEELETTTVSARR